MPRYLKFPESLPIPSRSDFNKTPEAHINSEKGGAFGYYASEPLGDSQWVQGTRRHRSDVRRHISDIPRHLVGKTEVDLQFEVAGGRDFRPPRFNSRPKDLPKHMGHVFEETLECKRCGRSWHTHRIDPEECEGSVGNRVINTPEKILEKIQDVEQEK